MPHTIPNGRNCAVLIYVIAALFGQRAFADLTWNGAGQSGADPFGNMWLTQNPGFQSIASWGMPGRSLGTTTFLGGFAVREIDVTFFGLPSGVGIMNQGTTFEPTLANTPFLDLWNATITGNSVSFTSPSSSPALNPGDSFAWYIPFTALVDV